MTDIAILLLAGLSGIVLWLLMREHTATVQRLERANAELRERENRLIEALTPALRRFDKSDAVQTAAEILKARHSIQRGERDAKCSCGWHARSEDPAILQAEIAAHDRQTSPAVQGGRKSWLAARNAAEDHAAQVAEEEIRRGVTA